MVRTAARTPDWKEMRRWRALELKRDGWSQQEIAEALGVTKVAVSQWMAAVQKHGAMSLQTRPHLGATPKLTPEQLKLIPEFLSHGAEAYGFRGEVWTCRRIAQVIAREFSVTYHKDHVSRLLKALRWTPQKPMERAAQRDEEKIIEWRSETWPGLKKKRGASSARPSLLTNRVSTCCPESSAPMRPVAERRCCARLSRATTCR
jgi:transposase